MLTSRVTAVAAGLIAGGALGNLADRVFRGDRMLHGAVIDFIDFQWFPIFNVADMAIDIGGGLFVLWTIFGHRRASRGVIHEEIPPALAGERLDRIVALVTDASRSDAAALVSAGGVRGRRRGHHLGQAAPAVRPGDRCRRDQVADHCATRGRSSRSTFTVVYDDEHVIVVDKPAGLVVHPGAGNPTGTLVNGLLVDVSRDRRDR